MKILVVGKGAREHSLCWRLSQSPSVQRLYCAPGNPGIAEVADPVAISSGDLASLLAFARNNGIDLTVVGPEGLLADGIVDEFDAAGLKIFGPNRQAARLETSKSFAKEVMREAGVPTADFAVFNDPSAARAYLRDHPGPVVVKADGLALGKGVTVCDDSAEALRAVSEAMEDGRFGAAGRRVIIERRLHGQEMSFFALSDGHDAIPFGAFQDHKPAYDGDRGPNTGGMGAYSPVPQFGPDIERRVMDEVMRPTLRRMSARGTPYRGLLYAGLMIDGDEMNVLEFNVRFGDPECEPLMMRFEGDLAETLLATAEGRLHDISPRLSPWSAACVILASGGYPGSYRKGIPISGLERVSGSEPAEIKLKWDQSGYRVEVFHAGTALQDGRLITDGGRVLAVTAAAPELAAAVDTAYEAVLMIRFDGMHFRRDVAARVLGRTAGKSRTLAG